MLHLNTVLPTKSRRLPRENATRLSQIQWPNTVLLANFLPYSPRSTLAPRLSSRPALRFVR
jgi:hypothetical protein